MGTFLKKMIINCDEEVNMTPLTFTAEEVNSSVKLTKNGSPTVDGVQYRIGTSGGWSPYTIDTILTLANVGDCVQFQNTLETLGTSNSNYAKFVITGKIAATGNCMSMLNFSYKMTAYDFYYLFDGCSSLTSAPELPATVLAEYCYQYMFRDCSSLTSAPKLPTKTLTTSCYYSMFANCKSLVNAPELPATVLTTSCYAHMFNGCSSLTSAPELPATTLAKYCYGAMFNGCSSLTSAPELPATILADYCYQYMFYGCTSLINAPILPVTTLANYCYYYMFQGCSSLVNAPELPATVLTTSCYANMFNGCSKLNYIKVNFSSWIDNTTNNWVAGVSSTGVFNAPSDLPVIVGDSNVPTGWTVTNN